MMAWIDSVFYVFMNAITKFLFYFRKVENCIPEHWLTA